MLHCWCSYGKENSDQHKGRPEIVERSENIRSKERNYPNRAIGQGSEEGTRGARKAEKRGEAVTKAWEARKKTRRWDCHGVEKDTY